MGLTAHMYSKAHKNEPPSKMKKNRLIWSNWNDSQEIMVPELATIVIEKKSQEEDTFATPGMLLHVSIQTLRKFIRRR